MSLFFNFLIIFGFLCLGIMIFLKIPKLSQLSPLSVSVITRVSLRDKIKQRIREFNYQNFKIFLLAWLEKSLRKIKIISLKTENVLTHWISFLRQKVQKTKSGSKAPELVKEYKNTNIEIQELQKPLQEEQKWINIILKNPKSIQAYKELGFFYWRQHNYEDAKSSLETALKLGSRDKKVREVLEKIKEIEKAKNPIGQEQNHIT